MGFMMYGKTLSRGTSESGKVKFTRADMMKAKAEAQILKDTMSSVEDRLLKQTLEQMYGFGTILDKMAQSAERGDHDQAVLDAKQDVRKKEEQVSLLRSAAITDTVKLDEDGNEVKMSVAEVEDKIAESQNALGDLDKKLAELRVTVHGDSVEKIETLEKDRAAKEKEMKMKTTDEARKGKLKTEIDGIGDQIKALKQGVEEREKQKDFVEIEEKKAGILNEVKESHEAIRGAEGSLRGNEGYAVLQRELDTLKTEIEHKSETELRSLANRIRSGDEGAIDEVVGKMKIRLQAKNMSKEERDSIIKDIGQWERLKTQAKQGGTAAWVYAAQKGKATDRNKGFSYAHNLLLSEAEQRVVHDDRGLDTPKTTLTELIEMYSKDFSQMSIESFMQNAGSMFVRMMGKAGENAKETGDWQLQPQDQAALMGLFKRGFDRAWIDDAIGAVMKNKKAKAQISDQLGWEMDEYTDDKIRDVQMLVASGMNVDFVKNHAVISHIRDAGEMDLGLDMSQIQTGLETGTFKDGAGRDVTKKLKGSVRKFMKEYGSKFTAEQEAIFQTFFSNAGDGGDKTSFDGSIASLERQGKTDMVDQAKAAMKKKEESAGEMRRSIMQDWVRVQENHQSELEFLGNLRSEALQGGHTENAGWSLASELSDGRGMYLGTGIRRARRHVHGDARKMKASDRAAMQSHSHSNIYEKRGQMITKVRESDYADIRGNIRDYNTFSRTNARDRILRAGFTAIDDLSEFRDDNSIIELGRIAHSDGQLTNAAQNWAEIFHAETGYTEHFDQKSEEYQKAWVAKKMMNDNFSVGLRQNQLDFLYTMAEISGVDRIDAEKNGTLNIRMYNPVRKETRHYKNINQLVKDYNAGHWGEVSHRAPTFRGVGSGGGDREQREGSV